MSIDRLRAGLADRYAIERELGQGGMATVYLAHDIKHDRDVAIKVLHADLGAALGADRFLSEIRTTARLQHPHILPLLDSGDVGGLLYYVMPLVTGETLRARLERERQLPIDNAILIAREVADALGYAHGLGVIHRDIKPENILLQGGHALVADFGIALAVQHAGGERMTQTGLSLGTPQYMSPEQAMGERTIDARSDIYALGAVTYEMLAGDPPFTGSSVQAIVAKVMTERPTPLHVLRDTVPPGVEDAVLTALAKLPADRFASAAEYAGALQNSRRDERRETREVGSQTSRFSRFSSLPLFVAVASIAAWGWLRPAAPASSRIFDAALPDSALMSSAPDVSSTGYGTPVVNLTVAGSGDFVVYPVRRGDSTMLWYRSLVDASAHPISGTAGGTMPRISPDGSHLAFVSANRVLVMTLPGGDPKLLLQSDAPPTTLDWISPTRLLDIANDGVTLHWLDSEIGASDEQGMSVTLKTRCYFGRWLADQKRLLCTEGEGVFEDIKTGMTRALRAGNPDGSPGSAVVTGQSFRVVDGRYVIYLGVDGDVRAAPYDRRTDLIGRSVSLVSGVKADAAGSGQIDLTPSGMLAFVPGSPMSDTRMVLLRPGQDPKPLPIERAHFQRFDVTRDGRRMAAVVITPQGHELRIYDLKTGQRQTWLKAEYIGGPLWDSKDDKILVRTWNGTRAAIVQGSPDAATPPDTVFSAANLSLVPEPTDYHDDANVLVRGATAPYSAIRLDLTQRPAKLDTLMAGAVFVAISPDGKRLVWQSQINGQLNLTSYPPGPRQQLVALGGVEPLWLSPTELLFRAGATWNLAHVNAATGEIDGSPARWGADPRFLDTPGWSNRVSWDGGIVYVQSTDVSDARFLRFVPDFVATMKAAVDKANR
ncbi:MAG TPA: serine/threonine-protein kinase [Gemmatimonadales bacterium]